MKIKILNQYIEEAKSHAFVRLNYYKSKTNPKERFNQIVKGKIGEEIVKAVLRMEKIPYEVDITMVGEPDRFDIKIRNITLEIKTISADTKYKALVISKYSFDQGKRLDYYILVEIDKDWDTAEIIGYATKNDFLENSTVKDLKTRMVYAIPIKSLKPFEELLKILFLNKIILYNQYNHKKREPSLGLGLRLGSLMIHKLGQRQDLPD